MEFFELTSIPQTIYQVFYGGITMTQLWISLGVAGGLMLVCLLFGGLGLMTMAKKAGVKHGWLGFLPFACTYFAGKLAGETTFFGSKMKRAGLYAMLAEIFCVVGNVFVLVLSVYLSRPEFYEYGVDELGEYSRFAAELVPEGMRWTVNCSLAMEIITYLAGFVQLFLFCILYNALFRKYYARSPFLMTFLCAVLPLRGFVLFAVRNNTPVDYDALMRRRMEEIRRQQQQYGQYGQYGPYGGAPNPPAGGAQNGGEPFGDFPDANKDGQTGGGDAKNDSPFDDF